MPYIPLTDTDRAEMLQQIGVSTIEELFAMIPAEDRLQGTLRIPAGLTELELNQLVGERLATLQPAAQSISFLGGGSYDHFIPAVVDLLASDPRFVTAYTPYQAEASQGSLQLFFEYQSLVARLTGMELSNASHYDGATACIEAVLMATATTRRKKALIPDSLHPEYRQVLATYLANLDVEIVSVPTPRGVIDSETLQSLLDRPELANDVACLVVAQPNFFGNLESVQKLGDAIHAAGGLLIVAADPLSLGILKRPGDLGADIAIAEGQPLGIPMSYGGPYLGILACRESLMRRMPGRLVGQTVDRRGNPCWVLTMQTREQHIRREKATSNICSNQGLMAIRACIYMAALGPAGFREVAELCTKKAHYLAEKLEKEAGWKRAFPNAAFFKEFVVRLPNTMSAAKLVATFAKDGIFPGVALSRFSTMGFDMHDDLLLIAVTEKRTRADMDRFVELTRKFS